MGSAECLVVVDLHESDGGDLEAVCRRDLSTASWRDDLVQLGGFDGSR
jgi:hypothetical protein